MMTNSYTIYQIKEDINPVYEFSSYKFAMDHGFNLKDYNEVYSGELICSDEEEPTWMVLEEIFRIFNVERPEDFKGHSLSMSDLVDLNGILYYVDSIGFEAVK